MFSCCKTLLLAVGLFLSLGTVSQAAMFDVSTILVQGVVPPPAIPLGPGFPQWYQDFSAPATRPDANPNYGIGPTAGGLKLELCPGGNNNCLSSVAAGEFFYWTANATLFIPAGGALARPGQALLIQNTEAIRAIVFNRTRIRIDVPVAGTYTVTTPFGVKVYGNVGAGIASNSGGIGIFDTLDEGCMVSPCNFRAALNTELGPFLFWDAGLPVLGATPGDFFIGDAATPHKVLGSPNGTNFFRVDGPPGSNLGGPGIDFIQTDLFMVSGKVFTAAGTINTAPVAVPDIVSILKTTPVVIDVIANDTFTDVPINPGSLTITAPVGGTAVKTIVDGQVKVTFTPAPNFTGNGGFSYTVTGFGGMVSNMAAVAVMMTVDTDSDGIGNNVDLDDDNDGVLDTSDVFPLLAAESVDTDNDSLGNNADTDDDNDGWIDMDEAICGTNSLFAGNLPLDSDSDHSCNVVDTDDDNDGVLDSSDAFPLLAAESADTDGDGIGNNAELDDDNDGVADVSDAFPIDLAASVDVDNDGYPEIWNPSKNATDSTTGLLLASDDADGDGLTNAAEGHNGTNPLADNSIMADADSDGLPDLYEMAVGLDPVVANPAGSDRDNDGYSDYQEYLIGLNPITGNGNDADSDSDGVADTIELALGLDPLSADANLDLDSDGLTNAEEIELGTLLTVVNANLTDSDQDSIPDTTEMLAGTDPQTSSRSTDQDHDGQSDLVEYLNCTLATDNAQLLDTDNDGLPDGYELANGLDPSVANTSVTDSDQDGYTDVKEYQLGLDPLIDNSSDIDSDGDGLSDLVELANGLDPNLDDAALDSDSDGIVNIIELATGTSPVLNNQTLPDSDGDGIPDVSERLVGTDPALDNALLDSDNDGQSDVHEYRNGTLGLPNAQILDSDGDGLPNVYEIANGLDPSVDNSSTDQDSDSLSDVQEYQIGTKPTQEDSDGDGIRDNSDVFPLLASETVDTDGDKLGNNADTDDDNDGTVDQDDVAPTDAVDKRQFCDADNDGTVGSSDALSVLNVVIGKTTSNPDQQIVVDVAPLINGKPAPDGKVTAADALVILRKSVGLW
jgi:hypothetical protein